MASQPKPYFTPEEYLALERTAATKSEYLRGHVYAMSGGSPAHSIITVNLSTFLNVALADRPCLVYSSDMRIKVEATGLFTYPDIGVVCGTPHYEADRGDNLLNPTVLVEVLSPSTEGYDRGNKFAHYRRLPSLQEYLLVAQDKARIEHYVRQADDSWRLVEVQGLEATLHFPSLACDLPLARVYAKLTLPSDQGDPAGPGEHPP